MVKFQKIGAGQFMLLYLKKLVAMEGKDYKIIGLCIMSHFIKLIQNLYCNRCAVVHVRSVETDTINLRKGVWQKCDFSPDLFNLYNENIMSVIKDLEGIKVGGKTIKNIQGADHAVLIATLQIKLLKDWWQKSQRRKWKNGNDIEWS